jgi:hypothetical protein
MERTTNVYTPNGAFRLHASLVSKIDLSPGTIRTQIVTMQAILSVCVFLPDAATVASRLAWGVLH